MWKAALFVSVVGLSFLLAGATLDSPGEISADDGGTIFEKMKCHKCHTVKDKGIKTTKGKELKRDLSKFGAGGHKLADVEKYLAGDAPLASSTKKKAKEKPHKKTKTGVKAISQWVLKLK